MATLRGEAGKFAVPLPVCIMCRCVFLRIETRAWEGRAWIHAYECFCAYRSFCLLHTLSSTSKSKRYEAPAFCPVGETGSFLFSCVLQVERVFPHLDQCSEEERVQRLLELKLRYFTPREVANLMGFPPSFCKASF